MTRRLEKKNEALAPRGDTRDDLLEMFVFVREVSDSIEQSIKEAGYFRILFLGVKMLRDITQPGYKFVMEYDRESQLWTVGHVPKSPRSKLKAGTVRRAKLDEAINELVGGWREWAENEKTKGGKI